LSAQTNKMVLLIYLIGQCLFSSANGEINFARDGQPNLLKNVVVVDYKTNLPMESVSIINENMPVAKTDANGTFQLHLPDYKKLQVSYVGFHDLLVDATELHQVDTLYMFEYSRRLTEKGERFKKNEHIKKNKIYLRRRHLYHQYEYHAGSRNLTLTVENTR
jgi:hypothetical protein